jgi:ABC-2 type transport system permease protein
VQLAALIVKETKLLLRDPGALVMLFLLPALFIVVLSVGLQGAFATEEGHERLPLLFVNEAGADLGQALAEAVESSGRFRVVAEWQGELLTEERARSMIQQGAYRMAVYVPSGTAEALRLEQSRTVSIWVDPAVASAYVFAVQQSVEQYVHGVALATLRETNQALRQHMGAKGSAAVSGRGQEGERATAAGGVVVERVPLFQGEAGPTPNSVQQSVPGWTIFALFWIGQIIAVNMINERTSGAFKRIVVSAVPWWKYMIGKTLPFLAVNLCQALVMFLIGVYGLPLLGCPALTVHNVPGLFFLTLGVSLSALALGLFLGTTTDSLLVAASSSAIVVIIMAAVGGIMVPRIVMPGFMQQLGFLVPHGWALDGYLHLLVRRVPTTEVLPHFRTLLAFAAAFWVAAVIGMRRLVRQVGRR